MRVALVYDRVNKWGGAERVLLALHQMFPDAPLYTSIYDRKKTPWANVFDVKTSFLQNFPFAMNHELFATLMPLAFENFSFEEYELVISVTSEAAKGILTKPKTKHICYCLTPTRYLWSGYQEYFKNPLLRFISKPAVSYLRTWDKIAAQRPDAYIAISKEIQRRMKKYYERESKAVYPPVDIKDTKKIGRISPNILISQYPNIGEYFLIVSRLVPYKKIDIAVRAFNILKLPLKIIGVGSELERLKNIAGSNIEFLGSLTDEELVRYYMGCRSLIFPGLEDFGLTIIEAQSFGKAIIAFRGGGALETIIEGKTGIFFDEPTAESLLKAVKEFNDIKFDPKDCFENAQKYSLEEFKKSFLSKVKEIINAR